ncbi:unnamed protein product [Zymoseptoria tritici ST99CH_1A5]|uniref:Uncharacterized protein n=1 Tax=Zymoseptoria tritici ST99CH_1A5 TaxID=1276529 RepID=A0A1Y6M0V2_ZYMTR|nr:unnamed protein product [Zymoseptoria tritici ST99CH_1A5]
MRESLAVPMENIMYTIRECEWHRDNLLAAKSATPVCPRTVKIIQTSYTQRREQLRQMLDLKPPLSAPLLDESNTILSRSYLATNHARASSPTLVKGERTGPEDTRASSTPDDDTIDPSTPSLDNLGDSRRSGSPDGPDPIVGPNTHTPIKQEEEEMTAAAHRHASRRRGQSTARRSARNSAGKGQRKSATASRSASPPSTPSTKRRRLNGRVM